MINPFRKGPPPPCDHAEIVALARQILAEERDIRLHLGSLETRLRLIQTHLERVDRECAR